MDFFKPFFDSCYDKLVLRDLFGKIVPGIALLLGAVGGLLGLEVIEILLSKLSVALWVITLGFAWLVGFALQDLGQALGLLRTHPHGRKLTVSEDVLRHHQVPTLAGPTRELSSATGEDPRDIFYGTWAYFHDVASPYEKVHAERLNIIKEGCGNAAIAVACTLIFAVLGCWLRGS